MWVCRICGALTRLGEHWLEPRIYDKLSRWFWSGVLGELYGGAVETRIANDYEELSWNGLRMILFLPRTVRDASFRPERFDTFALAWVLPIKDLTFSFFVKGPKTGFGKQVFKNWMPLKLSWISTTYFLGFGAKVGKSKAIVTTAFSIKLLFLLWRTVNWRW